VTNGEVSPSEERSKGRRAGATFVFVAAAFSAMAMLSVPLARLIPSPVRPFFTLAAPIEGLLHPSRGSVSGHDAGGRHITSGTHPPGPTVRAVPSAPGAGRTNPTASPPIPPGPDLGPAHAPVPSPGDRVGPALSGRDLQTLSVLNLLVDRFGFRVLMPLRNASDMKSSTPDLFALIARNGISALPPGVTTPRIHALLADLRQDLPKVVRDLRKPASPSPSRTAGPSRRHRPEDSAHKPRPPKRRHHEGKQKSKPKHRRKN